MSDSGLSLSAIPKLAAIATVSYGLNYLIHRLLKPKVTTKPVRRIQSSGRNLARSDSFNEIMND